MRHVTNDCSFQFKYKCRRCDQTHFQYLCSAKSKKMNRHGKQTQRKRHLVKKKQVSEKERTGSVFIGTLNTCHYGEDAIIPPFIINYGNQPVVRGMHDSGCQANLITQKCAKRLELKNISDSFPLKINGFNKFTK